MSITSSKSAWCCLACVVVHWNSLRILWSDFVLSLKRCRSSIRRVVVRNRKVAGLMLESGNLLTRSADKQL